jgi:hypothetical protein
VLEIDRRAGAVVFAHRVQRPGDAEHAPILGAERWVFAADEELEAIEDDGLGERRGPGEEEPVIGGFGERLVDARE